MGYRLFAKIKRYANIKEKMVIKKKVVFFVNFFAVVLISFSFFFSSPVCFSLEVVDEIVAAVNGQIITKTQLEECVKISGLLENEKPGGNLQHLEKVILFRMIDNYLLLQEAEKKGISASEEEIKQALSRLGKDKKEEDFLKYLQENGISLQGIREKIKREILREKMINWKIKEVGEEIYPEEREIEEFFVLLKDFLSGEKEPDRKVLRFYLANKNALEKEESVWIAQIIVKGKKRADEVDKKIKEGEDFEELAKIYSLGPNAERGGDLGWFSLFHLRDSLRKIIASLKIGEVSEPLKIDNQLYRILQLKGKKEIFLEDWRERIENFLYHEKLAQTLDNWLKGLRKKSFVRINNSRMEKEWRDLLSEEENL